MSARIVISPSQISTASCLRKWGYEKLLGKYEPKTESQQKILNFGTEMHRQKEDWFRFAKPFDLTTDEGRAALEGLPFEPMPGPGVYSEGKFQYTPFGDLSPYDWGGIQDLLYVEETPHADALIVVHDHKSTGPKMEYIKTGADLLKDPQAIVYSWRFFLAGATRVRLKWVYHSRAKPFKAIPAQIDVTFQDIAAGLMLCKQRSDMIYFLRQWSSVVDPFTLPKNLADCDKFRGCGFLPLCNHTPTELIQITLRKSFHQ